MNHNHADEDRIIGELEPCLICGEPFPTTEDSGPLCPDCDHTTRHDNQ